MSRLTNKDDRGRYYTVEEKILIANEPVNPTTNWITHNENRRYGSPIDKLGKLEDLEEELGNNFSGKNEDCSFKVLFEATKNGFWYQVTKKKFIHLVPDDNHSIIYDWNGGYPILQYMEVTKDFAYTIQCVYDVYFTDYKKKFWLREDKSE